MDFLQKFISLYTDGFSNMGSLGKKIWLLIFIKIFVMFFVLKLFFFPNFMKTNFSNDKERSEHIINTITKQINK